MMDLHVNASKTPYGNPHRPAGKSVVMEAERQIMRKETNKNYEDWIWLRLGSRSVGQIARSR